METVTKIEISKEALAKARLKEAYDLFKHEWIDNKIFDKLPKQYWVLGCFFDTIIDLLKSAKQAGFTSHDECMEFLFETTNSYITGKSQGAWYDDWCWWGNPTAKIFSNSYAELFNSESTIVSERDKIVHANLLTICTDTFLFVKTGLAPYEPITSYVYYTGATDAYNNAVKLAAGKNNLAIEWKNAVNEAKLAAEENSNETEWENFANAVTLAAGRTDTV